MSQPAISKHLKVLERAGLVSVGQDGARRPRRLEPEPLEAATEWIERYRDVWEENYQRRLRGLHDPRAREALAARPARVDDAGVRDGLVGRRHLSVAVAREGGRCAVRVSHGDEPHGLRFEGARDAAVSTGMTDGMEMSYQLLDALLSEA